MRTLVIVICSLFVAGCVVAPKGVKVVEGFDLDRYLGPWYHHTLLNRMASK